MQATKRAAEHDSHHVSLGPVPSEPRRREGQNGPSNQTRPIPRFRRVVASTHQHSSVRTGRPMCSFFSSQNFLPGWADLNWLQSHRTAPTWANPLFIFLFIALFLFLVYLFSTFLYKPISNPNHFKI